MGLLIKGDIETNVGPTDSIYCKIESYKVMIPRAEVQFTVAYWQNKEESDNFTQVFIDGEGDDVSYSSKSIVKRDEILFYKGSTPTSVSLPMFFQYNPTIEKEIEIPIYEKKVVTKEVPYISFDENGDEIVLTREVDTLERVVTKIEKVSKKFFDREPLKDFPSFCYTQLKKDFDKILKENKVEYQLESY